MIFDATVDGRTLRVEVRGKDGRYTVTLDGRPLEVDLHEAGRDFVSLLIEARSYDVALEPRGTGYTVGAWTTTPSTSTWPPPPVGPGLRSRALRRAPRASRPRCPGRSCASWSRRGGRWPRGRGWWSWKP